MIKSKILQGLIQEKKFVMAPGIFDAMTAKIAEEQGFQAVYMTGYGTCASSFGFPDLGFITMTEMVLNASRISDAVNIPLIADADTGYGNPLNVIRTVREYEKAGVAAIHLEDQEWPKRCGHMAGKKVIEADQMAEKIKAAIDTRNDMLIIARTDAIATNGFKEAIERAQKYADAGADIIFIEAPETKEQIEDIPKLFNSKPLLINMAPRTPNVQAEELHRMGYSIALYPGVCLTAVIPALREELKTLREKGSQKDIQDYMEAFMALNAFLKVPEFMGIEQKYKRRL